ncbi:4700_t:CDS:2, partial [Dentiscutata erythropus]
KISNDFEQISLQRKDQRCITMANEFESILLQGEDQNINFNKVEYHNHVFNNIMEAEKLSVESTLLQEEDQTVNFNENHVSNNIIEAEKSSVESTSLQEEDQIVNFNEVEHRNHVSNNSIESEKSPVESSLLQGENQTVDFIKVEHYNHVSNNIMETKKSSDFFEAMLLKEDNSFTDFDKAVDHVRRFVKYKGFKVHLGHVIAINKADNEKIIRKRTIVCKHSGVYKPKNPEKPGTSVQQKCQWHMNFFRPQDSLDVIVTTLNNNHNHELSPKAIQFEKNRQFTAEMLQEVEFLVTKCNF